MAKNRFFIADNPALLIYTKSHITLLLYQDILNSTTVIQPARWLNLKHINKENQIKTQKLYVIKILMSSILCVITLSFCFCFTAIIQNDIHFLQAAPIEGIALDLLHAIAIQHAKKRKIL